MLTLTPAVEPVYHDAGCLTLHRPLRSRRKPQREYVRRKRKREREARAAMRPAAPVMPDPSGGDPIRWRYGGVVRCAPGNAR